MNTGLLRWVLGAQAAYYIVTGALPVVGIFLFEHITGPKTDLWLVRMVGLLAVVIGAALGLAAKRRNVQLETIVLSIGSALAFMSIDIVYVALHRIGTIYLADAALEALIIAALGYGAARS